MKGSVVFCSIFLLFSMATSKKLVVTYLGTDFILPGGCPQPKCDSKLRDCRKEHIDMEAKFNECMATKALKQGCFTDVLPDQKLITIPVLANFCSKHCVSDNSLDGIHECPYEGYIHINIDPDLERRF